MAVATSTSPAETAADNNNVNTARANKTWAWAGIATFVLGFVFTWAPALFGVSESDANNPDLLFEALDTNSNLWLGRVTSGIGFLTVGALIVFASGYRRLLQQRLPDSLLPSITYAAMAATAGALIIASIFRAMLFDSIDTYDNSVHAAFYALSWDVALASWTMLFVAGITAAIAAFRGALPKWFGWLSIVTAGLGILLAMTGLAFPAHMPAFIWLIAASVVSIRARDSAVV
jgi:hypothetical protein